MSFAAVLPRHSAHRRWLAAVAWTFVLALLAALTVTPATAHAAADTTAPQLTSFTMSAPDPAAPNDQVRFDYTATDDQSTQLRRLDVTLRTPLDGFVTLHTPTTGLEGATAHTVLASWANGEYHLARVYIQDTSDNGVTYYPDGRAVASPSGVTAPRTHALDLSQTFAVSGSTADVSTPVLEALRLSSSDPVRPGNEVVVDYEVSDATGLQEIELAYRTPLGRVVYLREYDRAGLSLRGQVRETVLDRYPNGSYELVAVRTLDGNDNRAEYLDDGTVVKSPSGATGVTGHSLDLSSGDFRVTGSTADTSAPQLTSFAVSAPQPYANPGDVVSVSYTANDDSGRLRTIEFSFVDPVDRHYGIRSAGSVAPLSGTVSVQIPPEWIDGTYTLRSIWLVDEHENSSFLVDDGGRVTKSPERASGPTTHDFDLATVSFHVGVAAPQDSDLPVVESFQVSPTTVDATTGDAEVTIAARLTDASGAREPQVRMRHDDGHVLGPVVLQRMFGTAKDASYRSVLPVPQGSAPGAWRADVTVADVAGNQGSPRLPEGASTGFTSVTGGSSPGTAPAARGTAAACPPDRIPPNRFVDVVTGSTHERAINCLVWWRVASGRSATTYAPSAAVTRDAMAAFVARAISQAEPGSLQDQPADAFDDDGGSVHQHAINQLAAAGIVGGTGGGSYSPDRVVTRGQMATFLASAAEHVLGAPLPADRDFFTDDGSSPFEDDINRVAQAGLTGGRADGTFDAPGPVLRDQMGSFLARTLDLFVANGARLPA